MYKTAVNSISIVWSLENVANGLTLRFHCPFCSLNTEALADQAKAIWFDGAISLDEAKCYPYDFNKLVTFQIPAHNDLTAESVTVCSGKDTGISLYVAVHQETEEGDPSVCVSVEEIKPDWWKLMVRS